MRTPAESHLRWWRWTKRRHEHRYVLEIFSFLFLLPNVNWCAFMRWLLLIVLIFFWWYCVNSEWWRIWEMYQEWRCMKKVEFAEDLAMMKILSFVADEGWRINEAILGDWWLVMMKIRLWRVGWRGLQREVWRISVREFFGDSSGLLKNENLRYFFLFFVTVRSYFLISFVQKFCYELNGAVRTF